MLNPVHPYLACGTYGGMICAPKGMGSPVPKALMFAARKASLGTQLFSAGVPCSWHLPILGSYCSLGFFILTASHHCHYMDSDLVTHCLAFQAFLCNPCGSLHNPIAIEFCMSTKPVSYGECQDLPPARAIARPLRTTAAAASECLSCQHSEKMTL
jgi:hypothetical protein